MDTNNDNFDPTSIGAKPYSDSSFDPASIGAKPYNPQTTDMDNTAGVLGVSNSHNAVMRDATGAATPDQMSQFQQQDQQAVANANSAQSPAGIINNAIPDSVAGATVGGTVSDIFKNLGTGIKSGVRMPLDIIRGLFGLDPSITQQEKNNPDQQTFQSQFQNQTLPDVESGKVSPLKATLGTVGQVAGSLAPLLGMEGGGSAVGKIPEGATQTVSDAVGAAKQAIKPSLSPEEAAGQVIQGKTGDIPAAQRTLSSIDTTGVKTYKDLQARIDSQIKPLAQQVDAELAKNPNGMSIKSFDQTIGEGKSGVRVNYVKQGIQDLKDYYTQTNDAPGLSKMNALENKAKINGLTYKDVNDLARLHGSEINAFNANGQAASGLTKQAAENTRMGLKGIARQGLGGKNAQALDSKLTDLYDTKSLVDKQVETVNKANQKMTPQGALPKLIGKGVKMADTVTGGPLKAIGHAMGMNPTNALSPLDIEGNLAKNLKTISGK